MQLLPTAFAPAERVSQEVILRQHRRLVSTFGSTQLIDGIPDPFGVVNEQRQLIFANRALYESFGYPDLNQVLGRRPGEVIDCCHAFKGDHGVCGTTSFCRTCGAVRAVLSSLKGAEACNECRIMRRDGSALDFRLWSRPLTIDSKRYVIFSIRDISDEKRRQILEQVFFHDIMNLVSVVLGYSAFLGSSETSKEVADALGIIEQVSTQMVETIRAQSDLRAAEDGDLVIHPMMCNSLDFLQQLQARYSMIDVAKERLIEIAPEAQPADFFTDRSLFERVLGNLVKNAIEACAPHQSVTLSCGTEGAFVWFTVHNPAAIPEDVQTQIFQRSFSTKGKGRGIGTYSIRLLTERYLKGKVSFTSSQEQGTTFTVTYPVMI